MDIEVVEFRKVKELRKKNPALSHCSPQDSAGFLSPSLRCLNHIPLWTDFFNTTPTSREDLDPLGIMNNPDHQAPLKNNRFNLIDAGNVIQHMPAP